MDINRLVAALTAVLGALVALLKRQRRHHAREELHRVHCKADLHERLE